MIPSVVEFTEGTLGLSLSPAQRLVLKTRTGESLDPEERELWPVMTGLGLDAYHARKSITLIAGARSGKGSRICSPLALYESIFGTWQKHLTMGEVGVCVLFAQGQKEAGTLYGYVKGQLLDSPLKGILPDDPLKAELTLANGARIQTMPCTARSARGSSIFAGFLDEAGHYRLEGGPEADAEIRTSIRRGMLGFPDPVLVTASTPFAKSGILFEDWKTLFGTYHQDAVCFHGPTRTFNPTITEERLEIEKRLDPVRFSREFEALFSEDLDTFLPLVWVEAATVAGVFERPPVSGVRYFAAIDPSGAGADAFALAIVHVEGDGDGARVVQDVSRAWQGSRQQTVDLEGIVRQAADILRAYGCVEAASDAFGAGWVKQAFARASIKLVPAAGDRTAGYLAVEPLFASGRIKILDDEILSRELRQLERRYLPGGRTRIDHPRGKHDDRADALAKAGAAALAATGKTGRRAILDRLRRCSPHVVRPTAFAGMFGTDITDQEETDAA